MFQEALLEEGVSILEATKMEGFTAPPPANGHSRHGSAGRLRDGLQWKIDETLERVAWAKGLEAYYYQQPVSRLEGAWVEVNGQRKLMFATYSYLGLIQHPTIEAAAMAAVERYGAGTHGVRLLGGTLDLHLELEDAISRFHGRDAAIDNSSGYVTNLATNSTLIGKGDYVISDKWNHASTTTWPTWNGGWRWRRPRPASWWWPTPSSAWTATSSTCPTRSNSAASTTPA